MRNTERHFELALQRFDLRTKNEMLRVAKPCHGLEQFIANRRVLRLEIQKGHFLGGHKQLVFGKAVQE